MEKYRSSLEWLDTQAQSMLDLVIRGAGINTHTFNFPGIKELSKEILASFQPLDGKIECIDLPDFEFINSLGEVVPQPLGQVITITKRPSASCQVLLVCHMDTVYPPTPSGKDIIHDKGNILKGPGVADAKGGIVVMLKALEAVERSPFKDKIGWQVIINTDEEIGSPGSRNLLKQAAEKSQIGLVFEPCLPDGNLVGARKGSGNFTLVVRGKSAHAGREPHLGRNAICAMSKCILEITALNETRPGLTVNVGVVEGGRALNVVPDTAIARFNIRIQQFEDAEYTSEQLKKIVDKLSQADGISAELHGVFSAKPKILEGKALALYEDVRKCASGIGLDIKWHPSGGSCDGNRLSDFGLSNIDTMGVRGGDIHSPDEYLCVDSLPERARLAALVLMKIGNGELS